jgi:hypothetical protein
MNKWVANALGVAGIAALCLAVWGGIGLTRIGYTALENWSNAAPAQTQQTMKDADQGVLDATAALRDVVIALLRPCKIGKPETCGLIPSLKLIAPPTVAAVNSLGDAAGGLKTASEHASTTADAATGAIAQVQIDALTLNSSLKRLDPLLLDVDDAVRDTDAVVKDDSALIHANLVNFAGITNSTNLTLYDFHVWSHPILNPDPCHGFKCVMGRVVWPIAKNVLGLGNDVGGIKTAVGVPIPVKLKP